MTRPKSRGLRPGTGIADLVAAARERQVGAVAWLISLVESESPFLPEVAAELAPYAGRAQVVGLCRGPTGGRA
jgi:LAO/AO transport system kinase